MEQGVFLFSPMTVPLPNKIEPSSPKPSHPTGLCFLCEFWIPHGPTGHNLHQEPFTALRSFGGPIEAKGRLRYVDGCSDAGRYVDPLKSSPPALGNMWATSVSFMGSFWPKLLFFG